MASHEQPAKHQHEEIEHPPHVLRLLRLIREGTASHASRASALLGRYAASCSSGVAINCDNDSEQKNNVGVESEEATVHPSVIIWDLIGRLVAGDGKTARRKSDTSASSSGLFDFHWETRSNCALALESVARCLPLEDRRHFFEGDDESPADEPLMWLNVHDLYGELGDSEKVECNEENAKKPNAEDITRKTTEKNDSLAANNQMNMVVSRGRLLLASSGERYNWANDDEEAQEYIRENQALQSLDGTATASQLKDEDSSSLEQQSFLKRRVQLQRQILARRIGLGGILSAPILNENTTQPDLVNSIVKDGEFVSDLIESTTNLNKKRKATKQSGKNTKGAKKRKRKSREKEVDDDDDFLPTIDIRKLLIAQSNYVCKVEYDKQHYRRHRNPQLLLSTEVAYRTFDPQWTVRHGALLATLSLLRAWKVHDLHGRKSKNCTFGKWPHDILARCICIIALDRFADFSGTDIGAADMQDAVISGAVMAPCREMAAQIIAILLEAAPSNVWNCTFELLVQLYNRRCDNDRDGWEVRHGVLLTFKYVCALARLRFPSKDVELHAQLTNHNTDLLLRPLSKRSMLNDLSNCHYTFDTIIKLTTNALLDDSDDVRAVSAQVLFQILKIDRKLHTIDVEKVCAGSIWDAVCNIENDASSCAPDLLALFAKLLSHDCVSVNHVLRDSSCNSGEEKRLFSFDTLLDKLASFVGFDSVVVRISCLQAIYFVMNSLLDGVLQNQNMNNLLTIRALCALVQRLFYDYCENTQDEIPVEILFKHRNQAWNKVLDVIASLMDAESLDDGCQSNIKETIVTITLRYFDIFKQSMQTLQLSAIELSFRGIEYDPNGLVRVAPSHGTKSFVTRIDSAIALAQFCMRVCAKTPYHSYLSMAVRTMLQSPWIDQCEAGCLLHNAIVSSKINSNTAGSCVSADYLQDLTHLSTQAPSIMIDGSSSSNSVLRNPKVQSLCDDAFSTLLTCALRSTNENSADNSEMYNNILTLQRTLFKEKGVVIETLNEKSKQLQPTSSAMRLRATIAGSIVQCGSTHLPSRVTPIIQSLMTSVKSENDAARAKQTCAYIARLVTFMSSCPMHHVARNKLLEKLCSVASESTNENETFSSVAWAQYALELIISGVCRDELQELPAIWNRLTLLEDMNYSNLPEQQQLESALIHAVLSRSIKNADDLQAFVLSFVESYVHNACNNQSMSVRSKFSESILNLCGINFDLTMNTLFKCLRPILEDLTNFEGRKTGCELLLAILQKFNVLVSPYVATLLPFVMRLMTDVSEECSRHAASAFAILVRIAPLSAPQIGQNALASSSKVSDDVIRHLVLGKPLPPCKLPHCISRALEEGGTVLRPYQIEGVSWLHFLSEVNLNGALCDDMGLGKTLQALVAIGISHCSVLNQSASVKKSIVICPSTVVGHWVGEIRKFFPQSQVLSPFDFTGPAKVRKQLWEEDAHKHNIIVTSYSVLRSDIELLEKIVWDYCVLDEGHLLKNARTMTAKASRRLKAHHRLILTGTPIQNNVHELWATFNFLMPNFLGTESSFTREFAKPIVNGQKLEASASEMNAGADCLKILHQQVLPFVLRREKSQVMKELPPKIITDIPCGLSNHQDVLYKKVMEQSQTKTALNLIDASIKSSEDSASQQKIGSNVLSSLLQLRLICTHPSLYSLVGPKKQMDSSLLLSRLDSSGKLMALNDLLRHSGIAEPEIMAADNDSSGFLLNPGENFHSDNDENDIFIDESCIDDVNEDDFPPNECSKCLIFAQFTQSLDIIERLLFEPHMPSLEYLRLDGNVPNNQRCAIVDRFNQDDRIKVLLLTTKVGGLGLNLTAADKVIFLEPDWNPFVDLQAMDRAHRIGQTKTVNVYRLITHHTIEEKIQKLQERKKATAEAVVNADNSTMYSMGTDRLLDIFTFRSSSGSTGNDGTDNVLSYLDDVSSREYSGLSVDGFLHALK